MKNVLKKLLIMQEQLKAPKGQYNSFGKYKYRSCEDILENARPLANKNGCVLILNDTILEVNGRFYVEATATIFDVESGEEFSTKALAREDEQRKNFDVSQLTGACSSYARKYALAGLFALDDNKDADTMDNRETAQIKKQVPRQIDEKTEYLTNVFSKMKKHNADKNSILKIMKEKYNKTSSKDLTLEEAKDLDTNFVNYFLKEAIFNEPDTDGEAFALIHEDAGDRV